jgi:predicted secreted Zn-dependent protease
MQYISTARPLVAVALSAMLFAVVPTTSTAEPVVRAGITSYFVGGASVEELRKDIVDKAPASPDGKHRAAFTKWDVQWRWKLDKQETQCLIANAGSVVGVSMFVPKLRNEATAPKSLLERWKKYEKALRDHEDGRKDIAVRAGKEIEATLIKLKAEANCEALEARAEEVAKGMLENFRKEDESYSVEAEKIHL